MLYIVCNRSNTREWFISYPNTEKCVEKTRRSRVVFFNAFRDVWIRDKTLYIYIVFDLTSLQQVPAFKKRTYKKLQPANVL